MNRKKSIFIDKKVGELQEKATPSEKKFLEILRQLNIPSKFQYPIKSGLKDKVYIVDFMAVLHRKKIVFEIDGGYHLRPDQVIKDRKRDYQLVRKHYDVYRFTNDQIEYKKEEVIKKLQEIIMYENREVERKKRIREQQLINQQNNLKKKQKNKQGLLQGPKKGPKKICYSEFKKNGPQYASKEKIAEIKKYREERIKNKTVN